MLCNLRNSFPLLLFVVYQMMCHLKHIIKKPKCFSSLVLRQIYFIIYFIVFENFNLSLCLKILLCFSVSSWLSGHSSGSVGKKDFVTCTEDYCSHVALFCPMLTTWSSVELQAL